MNCPLYKEEKRDPEEIVEVGCPDHFNLETCECDLKKPWLECACYRKHYGYEGETDSITTQKIWFDFLNAESQYYAQEVVRRMGWVMADTPDGDGRYPVQVPTEEVKLFDFLDEIWS